MKIVRLESENIKGLRAVEIEPDGNLVVIGGKNGAGKSSVLDSMWYALGGKDALPSKPIRNGEKKARITLDLGDIIVERRFTDGDSKVTVKSKDGATYQGPQAMLDALYSRMAFDPLEFLRMKPKDQAEQLRQLVGIDFDTLDARRKKLYDDRTLVNRQLSAAKAKLGSAVKHDDAPKEELSLTYLSDELERRHRHNEGIDAQGEFVDRLVSDVQGMGRRIDEIDRRMAQLTEERNAIASDQSKALVKIEEAKAELSAMNRVDVDEIRQQIRSAGEINAKVSANRAHAELLENVKQFEGESETLTEAIENVDAEKAATLQAAPFPVPGLGIDSEAVTFNGLPLDQTCSAEQLRVTVAMGMAQNKKLRVMRIKEGSLLDDDGLQIIKEMAETEDYQVWVEKVAKSAEGSTVFIEDGAVKEMVEA